jgi:hypothetical protein
MIISPESGGSTRAGFAPARDKKMGSTSDPTGLNLTFDEFNSFS